MPNAARDPDIRRLICARRLLALAAALLLQLLVAAPAAAQYPCPSPGPNDQVVGEVDLGGGLGKGLICVPRNNAPAASAPPPRIVNQYASIAWHPDVEEVWMEGNFDGPNGAPEKALAACQRAMGGGCSSIGEWNNSVMVIARDWNGFLHAGWGANGAAAKAKALADCKREQPLPCEIVGSYGAGKLRAAPDLKKARKLYGAAAWVDGKGAPRPTRAWVATGHRTLNDATNAAIAACEAANRGAKCSYWGVTGNGVVQMYVRDGAPDGLPERNAKRGAEAVRVQCAKAGHRCTLQAAYDTRRPGLFVHDYGAAPTP